MSRVADAARGMTRSPAQPADKYFVRMYSELNITAYCSHCVLRAAYRRARGRTAAGRVNTKYGVRSQ
jgi:hypothetical protein